MDCYHAIQDTLITLPLEEQLPLKEAIGFMPEIFKNKIIFFKKALDVLDRRLHYLEARKSYLLSYCVSEEWWENHRYSKSGGIKPVSKETEEARKIRRVLGVSGAYFPPHPLLTQRSPDRKQKSVFLISQLKERLIKINWLKEAISDKSKMTFSITRGFKISNLDEKRQHPPITRLRRFSTGDIRSIMPRLATTHSLTNEKAQNLNEEHDVGAVDYSRLLSSDLPTLLGRSVVLTELATPSARPSFFPAPITAPKSFNVPTLIKRLNQLFSNEKWNYRAPYFYTSINLAEGGNLKLYKSLSDAVADIGMRLEIEMTPEKTTGMIRLFGVTESNLALLERNKAELDSGNITERSMDIL